MRLTIAALLAVAALPAWAGSAPVVSEVSTPITSTVILPPPGGEGGGLPVFFLIVTNPDGSVTFELVGDGAGSEDE